MSNAPKKEKKDDGPEFGGYASFTPPQKLRAVVPMPPSTSIPGQAHTPQVANPHAYIAVPATQAAQAPPKQTATQAPRPQPVHIQPATHTAPSQTDQKTAPVHIQPVTQKPSSQSASHPAAPKTASTPGKNASAPSKAAPGSKNVARKPVILPVPAPFVPTTHVKSCSGPVFDAFFRNSHSQSPDFLRLLSTTVTSLSLGQVGPNADLWKAFLSTEGSSFSEGSVAPDLVFSREALEVRKSHLYETLSQKSNLLWGFPGEIEGKTTSVLTHLNLTETIGRSLAIKIAMWIFTERKDIAQEDVEKIINIITTACVLRAFFRAPLGAFVEDKWNEAFAVQHFSTQLNSQTHLALALLNPNCTPRGMISRFSLATVAAALRLGSKPFTTSRLSQEVSITVEIQESLQQLAQRCSLKEVVIPGFSPILQRHPLSLIVDAAETISSLTLDLQDLKKGNLLPAENLTLVNRLESLDILTQSVFDKFTSNYDLLINPNLDARSYSDLVSNGLVKSRALKVLKTIYVSPKIQNHQFSSSLVASAVVTFLLKSLQHGNNASVTQNVLKNNDKYNATTNPRFKAICLQMQLYLMTDTEIHDLFKLVSIFQGDEIVGVKRLRPSQ